MRKELMKARIVLVIATCVACLILLVGCSAANTQVANEQTKNRQYMATVNQIMEDINKEMQDFSDAVSEGEVISLDSQLSAVKKSVEELKNLEVPEAMKDIHDLYVQGAEEMQNALVKYVDLYQDVKAPEKGNFNYGTYNSRLDEIQKHYDAGVEALKKADDKAAAA